MAMAIWMPLPRLVSFGDADVCRHAGGQRGDQGGFGDVDYGQLVGAVAVDQGLVEILQAALSQGFGDGLAAVDDGQQGELFVGFGQAGPGQQQGEQDDDQASQDQSGPASCGAQCAQAAQPPPEGGRGQ